MNKREAAFQEDFGRWRRACYVARDDKSVAWELKVTNGEGIALAFSDVEEHQIRWLLAATTDKGAYWKIPDDSAGAKPFDCFLIRNADAWLVVKYGEGTREFFMIPVDSFILEMETSPLRSLPASRAREIGFRCELGSPQPFSPP